MFSTFVSSFGGLPNLRRGVAAYAYLPAQAQARLSTYFAGDAASELPIHLFELSSVADSTRKVPKNVLREHLSRARRGCWFARAKMKFEFVLNAKGFVIKVRRNANQSQYTYS